MPAMSHSLDAFVSKWAASGAAERANKDAFLYELCDVLGVARPDPTTGDPERDVYVFERKVKLAHEGGEATLGAIDLYKEGCFILEAKQAAGEDSHRAGKTRRESAAWNVLMKDAYGQALGYARSFDRPPPFIVVCDLGFCFDLYACFDGSGDYRPFPNAQASRLFHADLAKHVEVLRKLFTDPLDLDPAKHAAKVTRAVAERLAELARQLEADQHDPVLIAQFLMRCLFTMFAEDVGLLPDRIFSRALKEQWLPNPNAFPAGVEQLWSTMNRGGHLFGTVGKILRFNGGLFASPSALRLNKKALALLLQASECDWSGVEPAIFGTLLERALDPKERHALGAHYTPRAYVERLVRPTIEEPLRADWDVVQAQVRRLVKASERADEVKDAKKSKAKLKEAALLVNAFHRKLCETRVLDPACGSGNFLYVTLDLFKRLEGEVLAALESLGETQTKLHMESIRVTPAQFHGIEVKRWAKEIAELVLWIGYLQWHLRIYGKTQPVPEPVLRDYKNIECRDAVLAWDGEPELVRDAQGKPVTRWDGESTKTNPVTGEQVPDESRRVPVYKYKNPRKAEWPEADFVVGNPPFIGNKRMRNALGDEYVEAVRAAHADVPETADFVMYWWNLAAEKMRAGGFRRFGLITTNSITQSFNRRVLQRHLAAQPPLSIAFAVPDHPWVDSATGAAVRIAMTASRVGSHPGVLQEVFREAAGTDDVVDVELTTQRGLVRADLTIGADVVGAVALQANADFSYQGVIPLGGGFRLSRSEVVAKGYDPDSPDPSVVRRLIIGRDIAQRTEDRWVIDFFGLSDGEARKEHPRLFQHLLDHVKPERDLNRRDTRRRNWWLFGENAPKMRRALAGLKRFIATIETSRHKPFVFLASQCLADHKVYAVASDDALVLGVLSSSVHGVWALAAGGRLGVGNDPTWTNTTCFLPFPFPQCSKHQTDRIRALAEELDAHRKRQQAAHPDLTITGMYNVLEKLRSGEALTAKEKVIHEQGLVSVLKKLHDDLDAAVFDAYGWPRDLTDEQILERLVALNAERAAEERRGLVRWLRPEFQNPQGKNAAKAATQTSLPATKIEAPAEAVVPVAAAAWPKKLAEQIAAVRDLVAKGTSAWAVADVCAAFKGAKRADVEDVLESLAALGHLATYQTGKTRRWKPTRGTT